MNDILLHVIAILSVFALCAVIYILSHQDLKHELLSMDDPQDDMIRKCIKDAFGMTEQINESTSHAELEAFYWECEAFDNFYRGSVPNELLRNHTDRLYDAISIRRDFIKALKVAS